MLATAIILRRCTQCRAESCRLSSMARCTRVDHQAYFPHVERLIDDRPANRGPGRLLRDRPLRAGVDLALPIIPRGLRSFTAEDAGFFLDLLPGPRDREGLPESIRFWKTRIEETDADETFRVGLIYGPSGCGKSSLVKAGLLPRLAEHVVPVYVEATGQETEARLLRGLRKRCPELPERSRSNRDARRIRRGQGTPAGQKVVIVLDQFEQWLHAHQDREDRSWSKPCGTATAAGCNVS